MAAVLLILLLAIPVLGYFYVAWAADRDLQAAIAEIERTDPRWRFDDFLADRKPIADEQNPALVVGKVDALQRLYFDIGEKNERLFDNLSHVNRLNDPQIAALREALTKHADQVKLARTLKDFSGEGRFAIRHSADLLSTSLEPLQRCRGVMSMLQHDATLRAEEGDVAGALESCQALLVTTRAIGDEPSLIVARTRFAGEAIAVNALERSLAQGEPPAQQLKAIQDLLAKEIDATFFVQAMRGERGGFDAMIVGMRQGKINAAGLHRGRGAARSWDEWVLETFPRVTLRGRADYLRLMTQAVEAAKLPAEKQGAAFDEVEQATRASNSILVRLLRPAIAKVSEANRRAQANLRCALVAVAAERYRLAHGQWPAALPDLVKEGLLPAVPVDPIDGQPLRCKLLPDGVLIYSVGLDGVDNGGVINRDNPNQPGTDLGFRLWNPDRRRQDPLPPMPHADDGR